MHTDSPAVYIADLVKTYPGEKNQPSVTAVNTLSLTIHRGEVFVFLGPNGAGKSTTINILVGITRKTSGTVQAFGYDVDDDFAITRRLIGVVPQEINADSFFTVREVLELQSGLMGVPKHDWWVEELLERLSLAPQASKNTRMLSGGMKRRLLVAKALVHKPKLLILDEPTAGVDIELREQLWAFVRELHQQGTTILLTTHYLEEAERIADRVALINHGVVSEIDTLAELKRKHRSSSLEEVYLKLTRSNP